MARHLIAAVLLALSVAPAWANPVAKAPSAMMAELNNLKPDPGSFVVKIRIETTDKAGVERCLKIFSDNGITRPSSIALSSLTPPAAYIFDGSKEYAGITDGADSLVAAISASAGPGQVTWTVSKVTKGW